MALTITQLFTPIQLPAAAAVLFTMPDATSQPSAVLKNGRVRLTNTSNAAVPVTLYAAPTADRLRRCELLPEHAEHPSQQLHRCGHPDHEGGRHAAWLRRHRGRRHDA
jgi:hypothetical protein